MPTAGFLGPFTDLAGLPAAEALVGQLGARTLTFALQTQQQDRWCWAAVTASVCAFFGKVGPSTQQCALATQALNVQCCLTPMPHYGTHWAGNQPYALAAALDDQGHAADPPDPPLPALAFNDIVAQIEHGRPVCCHIRYPSDPTGHYVVIVGYDLASGMVQVRDPDPGSGNNGLFALSQVGAAQGGRWDQSIRTQ